MLCLDVFVDDDLQCTIGTAGAGVTFASITVTSDEERSQVVLLARGLQTLGLYSEELRWLAHNLRPGQEVRIRVREAGAEELTVPRRVPLQGPGQAGEVQ